MLVWENFLWQPLLEASAQTIVGVVGSYGVSRVLNRALERNRYEGAMDFWKRGVHGGFVGEGETIAFDGLISPFAQLFPTDPLHNTERWNKLYEFQGRISNEEFQAMEFYAGADAAIRPGALNGETIVGLYSRYGFVGDGLLGVVPTRYIRKRIPHFFDPSFAGVRAIISGRIEKCPTQLGFVIQKFVQNSQMKIDTSNYKDIFYMQISSIRLPRKEQDKVCTLRGSPWAVTANQTDQYLVQYGYINDNKERRNCISRIQSKKAWEKVKVFFDDIDAPIEDIGFKRTFIK